MSPRGLMLGVLVLALGTAAATAGRQENEVVTGGGGVETDGLRISGLNLCLVRNLPGVAFAIARRPGEPSQYTYLLLIKGDEQRRNRRNYSSETKINDGVAEEVTKLDIGGKRLELRYRTEAARAGKTAPETFLINNLPVDLAKGRVVLVDLTGPEVGWRQAEVALPANPKAPTRVEEVEALAREHVRRLMKDRAVGKFLK
jgi:hypothetical protein